MAPKLKRTIIGGAIGFAVGVAAAVFLFSPVKTYDQFNLFAIRFVSLCAVLVGSVIGAILGGETL